MAQFNRFEIDGITPPMPRRQQPVSWPLILCVVVVALALGGLFFGAAVLRFGFS